VPWHLGSPHLLSFPISTLKVRELHELHALDEISHGDGLFVQVTAARSDFFHGSSLVCVSTVDGHPPVLAGDALRTADLLQKLLVSRPPLLERNAPGESSTKDPLLLLS